LSQLAEKIARIIHFRGPIPFARFMHLALYCPVYGYYEKEGDNIGCGGDYFTSVSVGTLFGELLACQLAQWLEELAPRPLCVVEAGAHRGELARDLLAWLSSRRPDLYHRLGYWIIEPSPGRRRWQQQTLADFSDHCSWGQRLSDLAGAPRFGVFFSNELLDAFPVHKLGWDAQNQTWFEWGVTVENGRFCWTRLPARGWLLALSRRWVEPAGFAALAPHLPDGFGIEVAPAALRWWRQAASLVAAGRLLTFDYGLTTDELLLPHRPGGTLRAYRRHQVSTDVLLAPGERDITAHVNFSALQSVGEEAGLTAEGLFTQAQWLTGLAARTWAGELPFDEWTPARRRQFQTLTHPEHLGRAFRVLVQARPPPGKPGTARRHNAAPA
jgi:SAM-dependent MidA family methyltransferase